MTDLAGCSPVPVTPGPRAVAIGAFDGVHLGHQAVVRAVLEAAERLGVPSAALTFEPIPRQFFDPDEPSGKRLTPNAERVGLLCNLGVEQVLVQTFDEGLRRLTPEEFAQRVLVGELQARFVAIGDSHTFGAGGGGTPERMQQLGHSMGFEVSVVPLVCLGELCVSSTAIRKALAQGDLGRAQAMLGRPYTLTGTVVRGHGLGQGLGAPTANLEPPADKLLPASGVYAAAAVLGDGEAGPYAAALTYGPAPTLDIAEPRLEVHLLDFEGDLYGQEVTVALLERLRPLETFDSREALIEQIARDLKRVRAVYEQGLRVP